MGKLRYTDGYDPGTIKPLSFTYSNPIVQDNTAVSYQQDPLMQQKKLQLAETIKQEKKNILEQEIYNKRKTQHFLGDNFISAAERDARNKEYARYAANGSVEADYTPFSEKASTFAWNTALALGPELLMAKGLPVLRNLKAFNNPVSTAAAVAREGDEIMPLLNLPKTNRFSFSPNSQVNLLQIRSTMTGSPLEKQVSKSGFIHLNSILSHINRADIGEQDKFILNKVLTEKFPGQQQIHYGIFKGAIANELIPLEITPDLTYSNYGIKALGYPGAQRQSIEKAIGWGEQDRLSLNAYLTTLKRKLPVTENIRLEIAQTEKKIAEAEIALSGNITTLNRLPKENNTLLFHNVDRFGRGSTNHFENEGTLGHSRYLVSKDEPDVYHLLEMQSDYFQKGGIQGTKEQAKAGLLRMEQLAKEEIENLRSLKQNPITGNWENGNWTLTNTDYIDRMNKGQKYFTALAKTEIDNWEQKVFLGKNIQDRLLQENISFAAKNGQTKVRIPTRNTVSNIEGYTEYSRQAYIDSKTAELEILNDPNAYKLKWNIQNAEDDPFFNRVIRDSEANPEQYRTTLNNEVNRVQQQMKLYGDRYYSGAHESIMRKYEDAKKTVNKLYGITPKEVWDYKQNSWYEFDIPEAFKKGSAEIKALSLTGLGIGTGLNLLKPSTK